MAHLALKESMFFAVNRMLFRIRRQRDSLLLIHREGFEAIDVTKAPVAHGCRPHRGCVTRFAERDREIQHITNDLRPEA